VVDQMIVGKMIAEATRTNDEVRDLIPLEGTG
jgi:hypothetical protein